MALKTHGAASSGRSVDVLLTFYAFYAFYAFCIFCNFCTFRAMFTPPFLFIVPSYVHHTSP